MWRPSLFFISNRFYRTQNNFDPLNDHIIAEFSWIVTVAPAVHWHFAVTSNVTVAIIKTIVTEAFLTYQITHN